MIADLLIEGGTVLTLDRDFRAFVGDVLVRDGRIVELGEAVGRPLPPGTRVVNARGCYVIPGFVQAHIHLCQVLFRGYAEDLSLLPWLAERIWPLEGAHTPESLRASARLGMAELLLGGTTSALDMGTVRHTEVIFEEAERIGFRLTSGKAMMDQGDIRPGGLEETTEESLSLSNALADRWHRAADGRLRYAYAPRFILSCTEGLLRQTAVEARKRGCLIHTHASENPGEIEVVRQMTGTDNVLALHQLGCTGEDVVLAHGVWLSEPERKVLKETGTAIASCPSTNLKLASGVAELPELRALGIRVGLGADGAPCNNRLSAFTEMRSAALLQKPRLGAEAMPARDVLRMATLGGAEALGIADEVGSIEVGKRADLVIIAGNRPHLRPRADPYATVVHAAEAGDVRDVFIDGQGLVRHGALSDLDVEEAMESAERELEELLERASLSHLAPAL